MAGKANMTTAVLCGFSALYVFDTEDPTLPLVEIRRPTEMTSQPCASVTIKPAQFLCCAISHDAMFIAVADSANKIFVLLRDENNQYKFMAHNQTTKRVVGLKFISLRNYLFFINKNGEVHELRLCEDGSINATRKLLGHSSPVTNLMYENRIITTSDRDGVVRRSFYPDSFNIEDILLSHDETIIGLEDINKTHLKGNMMTISVTGSIILWDSSGGTSQVSSLIDDFNIMSALPMRFVITGFVSEYFEIRQNKFAVSEVPRFVCAITILGVNEVLVFEMLTLIGSGPHFIGKILAEDSVEAMFFSRPDLTLYLYTPGGNKVCERWKVAFFLDKLKLTKDEDFNLDLQNKEDIKLFSKNLPGRIPPKFKGQ